VTSVSASNYAPTELGVFSIRADLTPEQLSPALGGMAEAVSRVTLLGPSSAELARARTLLKARWARRMEAMEGKAAALAAAEALDDVSFLDREYEALDRVQPADVREAAARYLQPDNVAGVVYLPTGQGPAERAPGPIRSQPEGSVGIPGSWTFPGRRAPYHAARGRPAGAA
jgi:predicted Zn-dependent peptidase